MRPMPAAIAAAVLVLGLVPAAALAKPRARAANNVPADKIMHTAFEVERAEHTLRFDSWHGDDLRIGRATETLVAGSILSHRGPGIVLSEPGSLIVEESSDGTTCDTYGGGDTILRRRCGSGHVVLSLAGYERAAQRDVENRDRWGDRLTVQRMSHQGIPAYAITARYMREGELSFTTRTVVAQRDYALLSHSKRDPDGTRTEVLRVRERELLPRTEANERMLRMDHPDATVKHLD